MLVGMYPRQRVGPRNARNAPHDMSTMEAPPVLNVVDVSSNILVPLDMACLSATITLFWCLFSFVSAQNYQLIQKYNASNFFDEFRFFTVGNRSSLQDYRSNKLGTRSHWWLRQVRAPWCSHRGFPCEK